MAGQPTRAKIGWNWVQPCSLVGRYFFGWLTMLSRFGWIRFVYKDWPTIWMAKLILLRNIVVQEPGPAYKYIAERL